jgi:hypothetical protein
VAHFDVHYYPELAEIEHDDVVGLAVDEDLGGVSCGTEHFGRSGDHRFGEGR